MWIKLGNGSRGRRVASFMRKYTVERAFELARSSKCHSIDQLRRELLREGYEQVDLHLAGALIRRQLLKAFTEARSEPVPQMMQLAGE